MPLMDVVDPEDFIDTPLWLVPVSLRTAVVEARARRQRAEWQRGKGSVSPGQST